MRHRFVPRRGLMRLGRGRRRWGAESRRVVRARRAVYHGRGGKRGDSRTSHHADQPVTDREQDRQSAGYREEHERRAGDDIDSVEGGGRGWRRRRGWTRGWGRRRLGRRRRAGRWTRRVGGDEEKRDGQEQENPEETHEARER